MAIGPGVRRTVDDLLARGGGRDLAATWHKVEHMAAAGELEDAPGKSTFYLWARQWREARERDDSGIWTLAGDDTGQPGLVMSVLGALAKATDGLRLTQAEARWVVKLGSAVPAIAEPAIRAGRASLGPLTLYSWAQRYVDASGDADRMAELDSEIAALYASDLDPASALRQRRKERATTQAKIERVWPAISDQEQQGDEPREG